MDSTTITDIEKGEIRALTTDLMKKMSGVVRDSDFRTVREKYHAVYTTSPLGRHTSGFHPALLSLQTAVLLCDYISPDRNMVLAILLKDICTAGQLSIEEAEQTWGTDVAKLLSGLVKVSSIYGHNTSVQSENFRNLLLTFANDIRVILIMIVDRLNLMKLVNHHPNEEYVRQLAFEAKYLYAPLAHRLGLYTIKSELEDMSLKYTNREIYTQIAQKLNQTKTKRDAYIKDFIGPISDKLRESGIKCEVKGRTKSIFSIWNKIMRQHVDMDHIYDLFAIRIIIDTEAELEKKECWTAYSIVTDMYIPNPARMKDWITIPKSNGYESLHITVKGPEDRWVEIQIRTRRMDQIAEKGLAAHWKYKGIKAEADLDSWMSNIRDMLDTAAEDPMGLMRNVSMNVYDNEVFVFTPKGDLHRLPAGASLLDFAFSIHSGLGCHCTGGKVNGRNRKITYKLMNGDTVEIFTQSSQQPKLDWLNYVVTGKARSKIRSVLKERESKQAQLGKELTQRRFKNRKIDIDESSMMRLIKKMGYKTATDFYGALGRDELDVNDILDRYIDLTKPVEEERVSAEEFVMQQPVGDDSAPNSSEMLVIDGNIKGMNYRMAKCCNPIYGDKVFGFISSEGVIKVHREDCPNAHNIRLKYPYRIIRTRWSGKLGAQFAATLHIIGVDDLGIVTQISSIINKEKDANLRGISIDSHDGLFQGYVIVGVNDTQSLNSIIKKIKTVKGVKDVQRSK